MTTTAEAKLERVRIVRELLAPGTTARELLDDALADVADPFVLPQEYGTRFWAKTATNVWVEFKTCRNYAARDVADQRIFITNGSAGYDASLVMHLFKDHTLEAPQVKASERV